MASVAGQLAVQTGFAQQVKELPGGIGSAEQVAIFRRLRHPECHTRHSAGDGAGNPPAAGAGHEALVELFQLSVAQGHDSPLPPHARGVESQSGLKGSVQENVMFVADAV